MILITIHTLDVSNRRTVFLPFGAQHSSGKWESVRQVLNDPWAAVLTRSALLT